MFGKVLIGDKICTAPLAQRMASTLRHLQTNLPGALLGSVWGTLDPTVRSLIEKLLADYPPPAAA